VRRREFITLVGSAAAVPLLGVPVARAQEPGRIYRHDNRRCSSGATGTARLRNWLDTTRSTIDSTVPASICATSGRLKCCWRCSPRQKPPMELVLPRKDEVFPALHHFGWFAIERLDVGRAGVLFLPQDDVSTQSKRMSPLQHDKVCGSVLPLVYVPR
jgi:hypothetical protein